MRHEVQQVKPPSIVSFRLICYPFLIRCRTLAAEWTRRA